jgi:hypothetical protein
VADFTFTKKGLGDVFPDGGTDSMWKRCEPLITPEKLRTKHLFGIPLVSALKDPITKLAMVMTPDLLMDYIDQAVASAELETGIIIFPTAFEEKYAWDKGDFDSFGYFRLKKRPITSIESMTVNLASNDDLYQVPLEWIEMANAHQGQLNLVPITIALTSGNQPQIPTTAAGALMLSVFQGKGQYWMASFWKIKGTAGFPDGMIPKVMNDLIGCIAAMEVLSQLSATYGRTQGSSMSIDGLSQSVSTPGSEIFVPRLKDLAEKRQRLTKKIKSYYGVGTFQVGNV